MTYGIVRGAGWLSNTAPLAQQPSREGMVPVPKSMFELRAFDVVQREDVYNLALGDDSYFWLPEQQVKDHPEWMTRVDEVIGRVMARDKRADFVFSEKDFLPEGSRSGIAGGIPAGKQGFFLDAEKIPGLRFLKSGDRFDLLASLPEESQEASSEYGLLMGGIKARGGKPIPLNGVRVLVQNAEMIALTTSQSMTTQGGLQLTKADSRGRTVSSARDERVAIAIDPTEAVPLTQALGDELEVHMVTRSGQETQSTDDTDMLKGRIAVPATAVSIEAFESIRAGDLAEPATGELRQYFFQPNDIQDGWITRPEDLIGRVVRRAVEPGYIFTEDDFLSSGSLVKEVSAYQALAAGDLVHGGTSSWVGRVTARDLDAGAVVTEADLLPPGSRPGFTAAVPPGRMGLAVEVQSVRGIAELSRGERCDLLASEVFDVKTSMRGVELSAALQSELQSKAINRVLATDALVIQRTDERVVLAIYPNEASSITKAIALETPVFCIARTGAVDAQVPRDTVGFASPATGLVSDKDPLSEIAITESLIGGKRSVRAYRRSR